MVHRIKNLVDKRVFAPGQILATSFNNSAVQDIRAQLKRLDVPNTVDCRTLHSLGFRIVRSAVERGYIEKTWIKSKDAGQLRAKLIDWTLIQLSKEKRTDTSNLNIDREDLQNQISTWKANLVYANLEKVALPDSAKSVARQAMHEHEQYVYAYQIYERIRQERKILTFDDMLMMGWEILMRYPDILQAVQSGYKSVIVDEFQDVNFAQYLIVDAIIREHRNYMAIGDDDQCIYEWRGANPRFILEFEKNYDAKVYTISDNFRSTAQQIVLANQVIVKNKTRYPKQLSLTKGFDGSTSIHAESDDFKVAINLVNEIKRLIDSNALSPKEMAVLIRLYSQTAFLEAMLIDYQIPYEIVGNDVFYRRSELIPLIQYLSFARIEKEMEKEGFPHDPKIVAKYLDMFKNIINKPRRYVARDAVEAIASASRKRRLSVIEILFEQQDAFKPGTQGKVEEFMDTIDRLMSKLRRPAHKTLKWLVERIGYEDHLLEISGMLEIGLTRVQNVKAMIEFAKIKDMKCLEFVEYIRQISLNPIPNPKNLPPVKIMTTYRAKGLEWDTVFVPGCNEGLAPCVFTDDEIDKAALARIWEAERRLFYVAITRAKKTLHLYYSKEKPISPFLTETAAKAVLEEVDKMAAILVEQKPVYREKTFFRFCRNIARFHLERYLTHWADINKHVKDNIRILLSGLDKKMEKAKIEQEQYESAMRNYEQQKKEYSRKNKSLKRQIRNSTVLIRKYKSALYHASEGQILHFELFEDGDIMALSDTGLAGVVEFDKMPEFDRETVIWEQSTATVEKIRDSAPIIETRFTDVTFNETKPPFQLLNLKPPKEPVIKFKEFLDPDFRKGVEILKTVRNRSGS